MSSVYVLLGPKGSGKSYIGRLLESKLGIKFLPIEEIFINLQHKGISTPDVQERGYELVKQKASEILAAGHDVSFEITVLTSASKNLLNQIGLQSHIEFIQVYAPPELCLQRIRTRDSASHIEISEEKIAEINRLSVNQQVSAKLQIDTSKMSDDKILESFKAVYCK